MSAICTGYFDYFWARYSKRWRRVVLTSFIGIMLFKETLTAVKMISSAMIFCGVLGLYLSQPTQA